MSNQRTLFDDEFDRDMELKRMSRRTDPATSHEAAAELVRSGRLDTQCSEVYAALRRHPGATSAEIAAAEGLDRFLVARRLPDLVSRGLAERCQSRVCKVKGTRAITWRAS